jgi:hypothetical protein
MDYVNLIPEFDVKEETKEDRLNRSTGKKSNSRGSRASRTREENRVRKMIDTEGLANFSQVDLHMLSTILK